MVNILQQCKVTNSLQQEHNSCSEKKPYHDKMIQSLFATDQKTFY